MKKILLSLPALITLLFAYGQDPSEALRFSWTTMNGTARQQAIGGAMGSLGGDLTATYVNPAGLGFFKTHDAAFTAAYHAGKNQSTYLGEKTKAKDGKFDIGSMGWIFASSEHKNDPNTYAVAIAINTTGSFKQRLNYSGVNYDNSYSQKFLEEIRNANVKDGNVLSHAFPFGSSLAFNTFWIDTVGGGTNGNFDFQSRSENLLSTGLIQEQKVTHHGGIYEAALGVAVNHNDRWMFGGTLALPYLYYRRSSVFTEADNTDDQSNKFNYGSFSENLTTSGIGANMKLGVIFKPQEFWRIGLAFHTPTLYSLTDEFDYSVTTDTEGYQGIWTDKSTDYNDGARNEMKYRMISPYRVVGSISFVLRETQDVTKQRGFLTADAEFVNYKASSYHPETDEEYFTDEDTKLYLKQLNKTIDDIYKPAFNFRAGGELKFTTIMVRAGAAWYGNPYKEVHGGKGSKLNLSGGLGYRNKGRFIDAAYVHSINKNTDAPYRLQSDTAPMADVRSRVGNFILTFGFKF